MRIGSRSFISAPAILVGQTDAAEPSVAIAGSLNPRILMQIDHEVCAVFRFGDRLRLNTAETIAALKARGLRLILVSGDGTVRHGSSSRSGWDG